MLRTRYLVIATLALSVVLASCGDASTAQQSTPAPVSTSTPQQVPAQQNTTTSTPTQAGTQLQHIFYIMMENHGLKAYMQSMPSVGYTGGSTALHTEKHNPFVYFADIRNNPARMQRIVPLAQFDQDSKSGNLPNFVWITPDVCSDMHGVSAGTAQSLGIPGCATYDGTIARGDNFIHTIVPEIMSSSAWKEGSAIVIAWDESDANSNGCCKSPTGINGTILGGGNVPLIVITSRGPRHITLSSGSFNHYSLLGTIEQLWSLGCLGNACGLGNGGSLTGPFG